MYTAHQKKKLSLPHCLYFSLSDSIPNQIQTDGNKFQPPVLMLVIVLLLQHARQVRDMNIQSCKQVGLRNILVHFAVLPNQPRFVSTYFSPTSSCSFVSALLTVVQLFLMEVEVLPQLSTKIQHTFAKSRATRLT